MVPIKEEPSDTVLFVDDGDNEVDNDQDHCTTEGVYSLNDRRHCTEDDQGEHANNLVGILYCN